MQITTAGGGREHRLPVAVAVCSDDQTKELSMSNTPFVESLSEDPVERAIARKVQRILNDTSLDRQRRENLVHKAQRELIAHRRRKEQEQKLLQQLAALKLPKGFKAQAIAVNGGQVQVGVFSRGQGFVWLEAGRAPHGVAANQSPVQCPKPTTATRQKTRKSLSQAIQERRKALGYC
ncbi:MAG: hypothetical protein ACK5OA_02680 [Acidovorax sp.]